MDNICEKQIVGSTFMHGLTMHDFSLVRVQVKLLCRVVVENIQVHVIKNMEDVAYGWSMVKPTFYVCKN